MKKTSHDHGIYAYALFVQSFYSFYSHFLLPLFTSLYDDFTSLCSSHPIFCLNTKLYFSPPQSSLHFVSDTEFRAFTGYGPRCALTNLRNYRHYLLYHFHLRLVKPTLHPTLSPQKCHRPTRTHLFLPTLKSLTEQILLHGSQVMVGSYFDIHGNYT